MPLSKHFGGHGSEVMANMKKEYGADAERVFYATENKQKNDKAAHMQRMLDHARRKHELKKKGKK